MSGSQEKLKFEFAPDASPHSGTGLEKMCFKCLEKKPLSEFYKHPRMADGHLGKCKECNKKDVQENYSANREQYAEYEKKRWLRPERREAAIEYQRNRRAKNPIKYKANNLLSSAIKCGRAEKNPCQKCGDTVAEAHHPDYTKPLDVVWLCRSCHLAEHGKQSYQF